MKLLWVIILLLVLVNCNNDLKKMEGHWQIFAEGYSIYFEDEIIDTADWPDWNQKCLIDFSFNTLDISSDETSWNKNALLCQNQQEVNINTFKKIITVKYEDSEDLLLNYNLVNDTLYLNDLNDQLNGYAIKTKPTVNEKFINTNLKITLIEAKTELKKLKVSIDPKRDMMVFCSWNTKGYATNCFPSCRIYANTVRISIQEIYKAYTNFEKHNIEDSVKVFIFCDEDITIRDISNLLKELQKFNSEKIYFVLKENNNGLQSLYYLTTTDFVKLLGVDHIETLNDQQYHYTHIKEFLKKDEL